jgi:hypothetical protein
MDQRGQIDNPHVAGLVDMAHTLIEVGEFNDRMHDRDHAISVFNKRIADVQAAFPASRLLTFNVAEGWDPLCKFLGCDVPAITFPKLNSSKQFTQSEWKDEIATAI